MVLANLDHTQLPFATALDHVEAVVVAHRAALAGVTPTQPQRRTPWVDDPQVKWKAEALEELVVALRDGELHAKGRYSNERTGRGGFAYHSGHHTQITPEQWREGRLLGQTLQTPLWEFIEIRIPRFVVLAIWPVEAPNPAPEPAADLAYTTPYLSLMHEAIAHFGLSDDRQEKKETLVDWFLTKQADDTPVTKNLADAMATLIRLPSSQRGGSKRSWG